MSPDLRHRSFIIPNLKNFHENPICFLQYKTMASLQHILAILIIGQQQIAVACKRTSKIFFDDGNAMAASNRQRQRLKNVGKMVDAAQLIAQIADV